MYAYNETYNFIPPKMNFSAKHTTQRGKTIKALFIQNINISLNITLQQSFKIYHHHGAKIYIHISKNCTVLKIKEGV